MAGKLLACGLWGILGAAQAWGQPPIREQNVTFEYLPGHWSESQRARLEGTEDQPGVSPIREMGWWYRLQGDSRERPFPEPDAVDHGSIWLMRGAQRVGTRVPNPAEPDDANWKLLGSADFDRDGFRDLLWRDSGGSLVIWRLDGAQQRLGSTTVSTPPPGAGWNVVAVGDFGKGLGGQLDTQDIVWQNDTSMKVVVWHLDTSGARTFGTFTSPEILGDGEMVFGPR